jgi:hypothetical protein
LTLPSASGSVRRIGVTVQGWNGCSGNPAFVLFVHFLPPATGLFFRTLVNQQTTFRAGRGKP